MAGATTLVLTPYLVKSLGPSGYGVWILLVQLALYGQLLELGVQAALAKHVASAHTTGDARKLTEYVSSAAVFYLAVGLVVLVAGGSLAPALSTWFKIQSDTPGDAARALVVLSGGTAVTVVSLVFTATLKGRLRFDVLALVMISSHLVRALWVFWVLARGRGLVALAFSNVASAMVVLVGAACFARRDVRPNRLLRLRVSGEALRDLMSFGFYSILSLVGYTLAYGSDAIIVGRMLSTVEVAQLGVGLSVVAMISGVIGAFAQNFMPLASGLASRDSLDRLRVAYLLGSRWCLLLAVPCVLLAQGWGPDLMRLWIGAELGTPAGALLGLLLLAYLPSMANSVGYQVGLGAELHRHGAVLSLGEGALKVVLGVSLAARLGLPGLVAGSLVSAVIFHGLVWPALLRARLSLAWYDLLRQAVLPAAWPAAPAMLAGFLVDRALAGRLPLLAPLVVSLVYSTIVIWANRHDLRMAALGARQGAFVIDDDPKGRNA